MHCVRVRDLDFRLEQGRATVICQSFAFGSQVGRFSWVAQVFILFYN